jgi:hypothetical protein
VETSLNSVGLLLDIAGALLLLRYGLPPKIDPQGHIHLIAEQVDQSEIALGRRYRRWSSFAVILLVVGFALQLVAGYI